MHKPGRQRQQRAIAIGTSGQQRDILISELLPRYALRADAQTRPRVVEAEDLAVGMAFLAHDLGADLAQTDPVPGAPAMKSKAVAGIAHVVPVALHAVPSNVPADGRAKSQGRHRNRAVTGDAQKLHAPAGRAMQNGYCTQGSGNDDAIGHESALQLALRNLCTPLGTPVAQAVLIGMLHQKWSGGLIVAEDKAPIFGSASAVGVIVSGRRFAVVPEDFARGRLGDAAQMGVNAGYAQVLAVGGVAEVEPFQGVAAAKVHRVSARRNRCLLYTSRCV